MLSFVGAEDGVRFTRQGLIEVNPNTLMSSRKGIFAGGDCVTGPAPLVQAITQGHQAARCIDDYLTRGSRVPGAFFSRGPHGPAGAGHPAHDFQGRLHSHSPRIPGQGSGTGSRGLLAREGIDLADLSPSDYDNPWMGDYSGAAAIFGTTGRVMEAALRTVHKVVTGSELASIEFEAVRGNDQVREATVDLKNRTPPLKVRQSHNNPLIGKIYDVFLGEPNSHQAHDLLHTTYRQRRRVVKHAMKEFWQEIEAR